MATDPVVASSSVWSVVPWVRALAAHHRRLYDLAQTRAMIPRRHDLYTPERLAELPSEGDRLLQALRDALRYFDGIGFTRSTHQREFHSSMMAACARHIFKDEFTDNFVRILQDNGWQEARQEVMICCPRRFGKTFAVGMYCAAYLYAIPEPVQRQILHGCTFLVRFGVLIAAVWPVVLCQV